MLDEADRMLDMGFIPDIKRIMALLPATAKRQNLLFSATFSNEIKKLADQLLNAPPLIEVAKRNTAADTVSQFAYRVPADAKRPLLEHLVRSRNLTQVLCFMRTKHGIDGLPGNSKRMASSPMQSTATRASRRAWKRSEAFKAGKLQVLVATDVAARGLDIDDLPLVLNYELPYVPEDYIHRIGRTGRAGASGEAISFVAPEEEKYLAEIERLLKKTVPIVSAEGFDASVAPERARRTARPAAAQHSARPAAAEHSARPAAEHSARPPRPDDAARRARAPRTERSPDERAARPPREDPRIERERAYALNPDQPPRATPATHDSASTPAPSPTPSKRHGFGHGRPVPALLKKRTKTEPENV